MPTRTKMLACKEIILIVNTQETKKNAFYTDLHAIFYRNLFFDPSVLSLKYNYDFHKSIPKYSLH